MSFTFVCESQLPLLRMVGSIGSGACLGRGGVQASYDHINGWVENRVCDQLHALSSEHVGQHVYAGDVGHLDVGSSSERHDGDICHCLAARGEREYAPKVLSSIWVVRLHGQTAASWLRAASFQR